MTKTAPSGPVPPSNNRVVRLLLIEPDTVSPRLRDLVDHLAGGGFRVVHEFPSVAAAAAALEREAADLVIADVGDQGLRTLEQLSEQPVLGGYVPFIVVDDEARDEVARRALQIGAQDYLVRAGLTPQRLDRSMRWSLERARVDREAKKESDLLRTLLENVPDRIYFKDRHGRFLNASRSVAEALQVASAAELIGRTDFNFYEASVAEAFFTEEQRVIETGQPIVGQVDCRQLPDGRVQWLSTTKLPLRDRNGRTIGTYGINRDVTDLKKLDAELDAERTMLRGVINNLPDPIYVKDSDGRYLLDNQAHARFLGVDSERDVIGKTVFDFFERTFAERAHEVDLTVLRDGEPWVNHEEQTLSNGDPKWLITSKVPLRDERGMVVGLVCINRDITERKLAQIELEAANASLQAAVADLKKAHQELHAVQLQLIEAEKLKSIGRLSAGVAHEVKNPLAIISMGVEFLAGKYSGDATTASVLKELADAVQRADNVIKGLLDYSAPRQLALEHSDLNAIIRSAITLVRGEIQGEAHCVELELGMIPVVEVDRVKVSQVFVNLFTNALQAMPDGGTLSVRTRVEQLTGVGANIGGASSEVFHAGDHVVIAEVADTGTGIPPEALPRIFEPFYTSKPTGKGTGLGMSVVRSIMNLQRGTVTIANRDGGGAIVTLCFKAQFPS